MPLVAYFTFTFGLILGFICGLAFWFYYLMRAE